MPSSRRAAVLMTAACAVGLLAAVPPAATARSTGSPAAARAARTVVTAPSLHWAQCGDQDLRSIGATCARLRVPLDYAHPSGTSITLALARVQHTVPAAQYQGVMLTNPGGPGASGRYLAGLGAAVPNGAGDAYDWIGFDPRGIGASRPAISCDNGYFGFARPNYDPARRADLRAWLRRSQHYATECGRKNGPILEHMTTVDSAHDLESIRIALGVDQINYYGFSYGTYLGQVYATLYPDRVRRIVLDSNVDPRGVWYAANLQQDTAFQRNTVAWFRWLAQHDGTYHLGRTELAVQARWYRIRNRLADRADHGIGPDEWTDVFLDAAYYQSTWLDKASLFEAYVRGHDYTAIRQAYLASVGGSDNGFAGYNAVQCTDTAWPRSWARWRRDNDRVNRTAPFETWANAWYNAPCLYWPAPAHRPVRVDGHAVGPILLIDETRDAATPYEGSLEVRALFPQARLIALPGGTSHANSLGGDSCLDDRIAAYLHTGALPARKPGSRADLTCAPLPQPQP